MSSELAFNAYVFLPNALNLIQTRMEIDYPTQLDSTREQIEALHALLLAPKPNEILHVLDDLTPADRTLLLRCGLLCLQAMDDVELEALMGLPRSEVEAVLLYLDARDSSDTAEPGADA